jgi:signal transduction histidine kinase
MNPPAASVPPAAPASATLSSFLTRLIWLCVLPLLLLAGWLAYVSVRDVRHHTDQDSLQLATNYAATIDQELRARIRGLQLLDASPLVDDPAHWPDLYRQARMFEAQFGGHVTFAEAREPMRIIFDTQAPFGSPQPDWVSAEARSVAALAVAGGAPAVGNVCSCRQADKDSVAIAVPVRRDGAAAFVLVAAFRTAYFQQRLQEVAVRAGWHLGLVDGRGTTIAWQGAPPGSADGADGGMRRVAARSKESPWSVVVEIAAEFYRPPLTEAATVLSLAVISATLIGVLGGALAGRRLDAAVAGLAEDSAFRSPPSGIREIDAARRKLDEAAALRDSNELLEQKVAERTAELAEARNRISAFAAVQEDRIEQERRRLAREVHDQLGQVFTAIKLIVQSVPRGSLPAEQHEALGHALEVGIASARRIAGELRPPLLDDFGLAAAIGHFARETLAPAQLAFEVDVRDDDRLGPPQALALFRIAQEAVTNALRHAKAARIRFAGHREGDRYVFAVEDDGRGFAPSQARPGAMGITSMSERASLFGGAVRVTSTEGKGTRIEATLPLTEAGRDEHPAA